MMILLALGTFVAGVQTNVAPSRVASCSQYNPDLIAIDGAIIASGRLLSFNGVSALLASPARPPLRLF
jgi:hypothetical protein